MKLTGCAKEVVCRKSLPSFLSSEPRHWGPTVDTYRELHKEVFTSGDLAWGPHQWRSSPVKPLEALLAKKFAILKKFCRPIYINLWSLAFWDQQRRLPRNFTRRSSLQGDLHQWKSSLRSSPVEVLIRESPGGSYWRKSLLFNEISLHCKKLTLSLDYPV